MEESLNKLLRLDKKIEFILRLSYSEKKYFLSFSDIERSCGYIPPRVDLRRIIKTLYECDIIYKKKYLNDIEVFCINKKKLHKTIEELDFFKPQLDYYRKNKQIFLEI